MRMRIRELCLTCRKSVELIKFDDVTYFFGEIGAGKSTIARLIDYCLGSTELVMTPALQSEFVAAKLDLFIGDVELTIERARDSKQVLATWDGNQLLIPARNSGGVVLPNTKVEVLSDLIFYLIGMDPPKVRKSKLNEDSDLARLSFRDLWWYCYLDQDSMDSSFYHLEQGGDPYKRYKSRDVLRSVLGVHQERVGELEQRLEDVRRKRQRLDDSAEVLEQSLLDAGFATLEEIAIREKEISDQSELLNRRIRAIRDEKSKTFTHVTDSLRQQARNVVSELESIEVSLRQLDIINADDQRHRNEILALSTKVRRLESARAVLNDVDFETCPRCTRSLPKRPEMQCHVCGQDGDSDLDDEKESERTQVDISSRIKEIEEMIDAQTTQIRRMRRRRDELKQQKQEIDERLVTEMQQYDSAYLSEAIGAEKELASVTEELVFLRRVKVLPQQVDRLRQDSDLLASEESELRRELNSAREAAERDLSNLQKLKALFLDCLVRARVPGFEPSDIVHMSPPWFLPDVHGKSGELATTSFSTLGSGGKKSLFKCCFAIAIHRLAASLKTLLPSVMIIDSPMKNISERENREQFEGFHSLIYDLAVGELAGTQIVLIDKEFCPPASNLEVSISSRHMRVDSEQEPPLIPYYRD